VVGGEVDDSEPLSLGRQRACTPVDGDRVAEKTK
jgi:hypothetical protein